MKAELDQPCSEVLIHLSNDTEDLYCQCDKVRTLIKEDDTSMSSSENVTESTDSDFQPKHYDSNSQSTSSHSSLRKGQQDKELEAATVIAVTPARAGDTSTRTLQSKSGRAVGCPRTSHVIIQVSDFDTTNPFEAEMFGTCYKRSPPPHTLS